MRRRRSDPIDVVWRGESRSTFALPLALVLVVGGIVLAGTVHVALGAVIAVAGLAPLALVRVEVELTSEAVRVVYGGALRWPTTTIPVSDITSVEAVDVVPWRHGGWGYRGSLRLWGRAAVVLRRGPGLRLGLRGGRRLVVTVDDAHDAATRLTSLSGSHRG